MAEYNAADVLLGRSRTRRRILALLAEHPSERRHLRGIARAVGTSAGTASRELRRLESAGLVIRTREGAQVYHQANVDSPALEPVRALLRTAGAEPRLAVADPVGLAVARELAARLPAVYGDRLRGVYLYGSRARGDHRPDSDVDVLIILDRIEDYGRDLGRSTDVASDLSLEHGVSVTCMLVPEEAWETADRPFVRAVAPACAASPGLPSPHVRLREEVQD